MIFLCQLFLKIAFYFQPQIAHYLYLEADSAYISFLSPVLVSFAQIRSGCDLLAELVKKQPPQQLLKSYKLLRGNQEQVCFRQAQFTCRQEDRGLEWRRWVQASGVSHTRGFLSHKALPRGCTSALAAAHSPTLGVICHAPHYNVPVWANSSCGVIAYVEV